MIKKLFGSCLVMMLLCVNAQAQSLNATVNRSQIPEGETFLLTLEYDGAKVNEAPDLAPLEKDFNVYSVSNSYRTNIINGNMSQSVQWNLVLMPKTSGELTIPALSLGNLQSNPVKITVGKAAEITTADSKQPRFAIKAEVDNKNPYVQQQVNYTLTILDTGGLQGNEPIFVGTNSNDWIIKNLGAPSIKNVVIDGKNIREIKFHFAFFPQRSGELMLPEAKFNGFYQSQNPRRTDPFADIFGDDMMIAGFGLADVFASRTPVVLAAKPIALNVRPAAPQNNGSWWIPAEEVRLFAQWEPENPHFKVGEAVNRTIYLQATGVIDTQLPDIKFPMQRDLKQYPEKPQTRMEVQNGQVVSLKKISTVYIPNQAGKITIPAINIDWFNVKTNTMEKAILPEVSINVSPAANQSETPTAEEESPVTSPIIQQQPQKIDNQIVEVAKVDDTKLYLLLFGAFILGIGISYLFIRPKKEDGENNKIHNYKRYIISKAEEKDYRALRDGILEWAAHKYKLEKISNLNEVGRLTQNKEFMAELDKLTAILYADSNIDWNAQKFIKTFEKVYKQKARKKNDDKLLPELYR